MSLDLAACSPLPLRLRINAKENNFLELYINNDNPIMHEVGAYQVEDCIVLTSINKIPLSQVHLVDGYECNYFTLSIFIKNNVLDIEKSKVNLCFERDNSFMEVSHVNFIDYAIFEPIHNSFSKAFGSFVSAGSFLQHLATCYKKDFLVLANELLTICTSSAVLNQGNFELPDFDDKTFNFCILRDMDKELGLEDELLHYIIISYKQFCVYLHTNPNSNIDSQLKEMTDIDVLVIISYKDIEDYNAFGRLKIKCSPGLFSSSKSLCKQLSQVAKQTKDKKLKDRKNLQKDGACTGPKEDGSCCGGGCGGDKKSQNSANKKGNDCGMGENCCGGNDCGSVKIEEINTDNKKSCEGNCGSCSDIADDLKKMNIEKTGCCKGKTDSSCCKRQ